MPRKLWKPTRATLSRITELKAGGATDKAIATDLGIRWEVFCRKKGEFPEIGEAIARAYQQRAEEAIAEAPLTPGELFAQRLRREMDRTERKWARLEKRYQ